MLYCYVATGSECLYTYTQSKSLDAQTELLVGSIRFRKESKIRTRYTVRKRERERGLSLTNVRTTGINQAPAAVAAVYSSHAIINKIWIGFCALTHYNHSHK